MHRRQILATATSASLLPLTGCSGVLSGPTDFGNPEVEMDADGMEKHLIFTHDSERQAIITLDQRSKPPSLEDQIPFRLIVWHRDGLSIDRIKYKLRTPPHTVGVPANIFLQVPDGGPWPEFELRTEGNQWTVISVDEIGELGDGSLGLDLIINPVSEAADELAVIAEIEFSEPGVFTKRYQATANTRFDILPAQD